MPAGGSVQCEEAPYLGVLLGEGGQLQRVLGAAELQPPVQPGGRGQLLPDRQGGQLHLVQPLHQTRSAAHLLVSNSLLYCYYHHGEGPLTLLAEWSEF